MNVCRACIVEDDGLPSFVCKECLTSVQMIADFATKVRESDRKLRQLFKSEVTLKAIEEPNTEEGESDVLSTALDQVKVEYDDDVEKVEKSVSESEGESESDALDFEDGNDSDWNDAEQKQSEDELEIATAKRKTKQKAVVEQDSDEDEEEASSSKRPKRRSAKKKVVKDDDDEDEDDDMAEDTMTEMEQEMFELVKIDPARHICCWCCKDFETRDELKAHGVEHNDRRRRQTYKPHSCEICYRRFIRVKSFENHMIMAAGLSAKEIHQCKRCSARFLAPKRRRMHALCHHKEDEKLAQLELKRKKKTPTCCNRFCYQEFTTEEELLEHGLKEHISNKRAEVDPKQPHECPVCYKNFESKKSLHRHRNRIYRAGMQCSICGKEFKSRPAMMTHERKHVDERPYGCEICGKWFTTTHGLKNHLAVHKDERPFACSVCGWSFKRECNLKMHMLIHSDTLPFKCEVCGKSFKVRFVRIFEDDGLPTQICSTCLSDLRQTKNFVRKVRASDRKLRRSQRSELCEVEKLDSGDHVDDDDSPWQMIQVHVEEMKLEKEDETESNSGATRARKSRRMVKRTRFAPSDSEEDESVDELHKLFKKKVTCKDDDDDAPMELSTVKRQMMRRQKRRVVDDSQSTESETDSEPVIRRRRKPRARKRENSLAKHDYSEDEHIPSETLHEMYRTVSVDPDTHVCCACLRIFTDRAELVEHGKVAHNKKKYVNEAKTNICDVCFRRYSKASALQTHKQSFVGLNGVYECCRCMTRVTAQNRRQHARIHLKHRDELTDHEKPRRAQICCAKDCLASFPTEDLLLAHGKEQHIDNRIELDDLERRYECPVCFKRFEKRDGLTRIKPYRCEMCNRTFGQKAALKKHLDMHPLAPENQLSLAQPSPMAEMPMSPQMPPPPAPTTVAQGMTLQQAAVMMAGSGAGYSQQPM
ncbi:zinc finger protein 394 [Culex quinquefasciatus]|uniref:Zinc finger protein 394 n=1 Tax=Culex quinquefasciatus TaxID=7176 RepID=B0WG47_CULQU|nr:zinc finger protein 394 [Culex quinquefasciatus]|eukprot:XP_001847681.1 zinc finger protein 394 [Culex quinquefasciatus]